MARLHFASRVALGISAFVAIETAFATPAHAGGYDTPILYSARHMGMGGTAIGYVDDPSSLFHNPAGLNGIHGLEVMADVSPLFGSITSSPGETGDVAGPDGRYPSRTTQPAVSPLFLGGVGYRVAEPVTLGFGVYPVAAAAGEYKGVDTAGNETIDKTRLVFIEFSPGVAVQLMRGLSLGVGYRATLATLERVKGAVANPTEFNFTVSGVDATGVRAGLQWHPTDDFSVGVVYRHKIAPTLKADNVHAYNDLISGSTVFTLPSKLGLGLSGKLDRLHGAFDLEYGFYSQNTTSELIGYNPALKNKMEHVTNYFEWQNAVTLRFGLEYLLGAEHQFATRVGYIFDGKVGNKAYPTAFGTPPAPSHSVTAGVGYRAEKWQTNLAAAYRISSAEVTPADVAGSQPCPSCSKPGSDYNLKILGLYLDFSYRFDVAPIFGGAVNTPAVAPATGAAPSVAPPPAPTPDPTPGSPSPAPMPTPAPSPTP